MQLTFPNSEILDILPDDNSIRYRSIMGENVLSISFSLSAYQNIPKGTTAIFQGEKYHLNISADITKINNHHFDYKLTMESEGAVLKSYKFNNPNDRTLKFPYTATPRFFLAFCPQMQTEKF